jgi:putative flippase GtrA
MRPVDLDGLVDRVFGTLPVLGPWYRRPGGRKKVRYALVSVVAVPVGTAGVVLFNVVQSSALVGAVLGNSVGAVPSYLLNRYWVWQKGGRNRLLGEILPFWVITLIGIGFSGYVGHEAGQFTRHHHVTGLARAGILAAANLAGFGVLWVAKYVLFDRVLFVVRHHGEEPVGSA